MQALQVTASFVFFLPPDVTEALLNSSRPDSRLLFQRALLFCAQGEFIIGRVIKAMNNSWHPDCFCCDICQAVLADVGFVKNAGRSVFISAT